MGAFFEKHGALNSSEAMTAFVGAIQKMREHAVEKEEWVGKGPIGQLLFSTSMTERHPKE